MSGSASKTGGNRLHGVALFGEGTRQKSHGVVPTRSKEKWIFPRGPVNSAFVIISCGARPRRRTFLYYATFRVIREARESLPTEKVLRVLILCSRTCVQLYVHTSEASARVLRFFFFSLFLFFSSRVGSDALLDANS